MNKSKAKGTAAETALVKHLKVNGFPGAKRIPLAGNKDEGDVDFVPGSYLLMAEVKSGKAAEAASINQIQKWLLDASHEKDNGAYSYSILVTKRAGYGENRVHFWTVHMWLQDLIDLVGRDPGLVPSFVPVSMTVGSFIHLLTDLGYTR